MNSSEEYCTALGIRRGRTFPSRRAIFITWLKPFALVPGMFFGFTSTFATYFGGFGHDSGHLGAAFVSAAAMCALGPLCAAL